jgi:hypothetical protein
MAYRKPTPKYVLPNPNVEILGDSVAAMFKSLQADEYTDLLIKYGYDKRQPDKWYRDDLEFYRDLMQRPNMSTNLVSIGMSFPEMLPFADSIHTIPDALRFLNEIVDMMIRNYGDFKFYEFEEVGPRHFRMTDNTFYPHDMIYGVIYGTVKRFKPAGSYPTITRTYFNEADPDADGAVYDIKW